MSVKRLINLLIFIGVLGTALVLAGCGLLDSQDVSARTPDEAIADSVRAYLDEEGRLGDHVEVEIELLEGDFARVKIISTDPGVPGGFTGFLKRQDGVWTTLIADSGFAAADLQTLGIPEIVLPEGWSYDVAAPDSITEDGSLTGSDCPTPVEGTLAHTNVAHGYCLLYPEEYTVAQPNPDEIDLVIGDLMNHTDPRVSIKVEPSGERTASQAADELLKEYDPASFNIERSDIVVGGQEAVMLDKMPGQDLNRQLLTVHEGLLYHFFFAPFDSSSGDTYSRMVELYETVIGSFVFQVPSLDEIGKVEDSESGQDSAVNRLIELLGGAEVDVQDSGEAVVQPFFSPPGRALKLGGADIQLFIYDNVEAASAEAALVAPDGGSVGTHMVAWMASPHFYQSGQFIVLYVGDDAAVLKTLESALGPQFAGAE